MREPISAERIANARKVGAERNARVAIATIRKSLLAEIDNSTAADPEQFLDQCVALIDAHRKEKI
jgi:hypothetical protein